MKRAWLIAVLLGLGMAAAQAIPRSQQIIIFGKQGSASNPPPVTCGTGVIDLSAGCTLPLQLGLVP